VRFGERALSERTLSKIRSGERGMDGAIDQLVRLGVPKPEWQESPADWLSRLERDRHLQRRRHPGLFTYCFELTQNARRRGRDLPRLAYPKLLPETAHC
jgi:hypothetical protein